MTNGLFFLPGARHIEWQWNVGATKSTEIKLSSDYIQIKLGYRKEPSLNFYYITVGGYYR